MHDAEMERESESNCQLDDISGNTHELIIDDVRLNFFQLENLITSLDLKSSIIIAIDAILIAGGESMVHFNEQIPIHQFFIIIPPMLSISMAVFCLWPRTWLRPNGLNTINNYADKKFDYAASKIAKNYADGEEKLKLIYVDKFEYFQHSVVLATISIVISFILILNQILSS